MDSIIFTTQQSFKQVQRISTVSQDLTTQLSTNRYQFIFIYLYWRTVLLLLQLSLRRIVFIPRNLLLQKIVSEGKYKMVLSLRISRIITNQTFEIFPLILNLLILSLRPTMIFKYKSIKSFNKRFYFFPRGWLNSFPIHQQSKELMNKDIINYMINQAQRIRLKLIIKKIAMNIKFPCSLTLQIRGTSSEAMYDLSRAYEIKNGECVINQSAEIEIEIQGGVSKNKDEKKVTIFVSMLSLSGKVSAGFASILLAGKEGSFNVDNVQFLQKCPDKTAKIYYSYSVEALSQLRPQRLDKTLISDLKGGDRVISQQAEYSRKTTYNSVQIPLTTRQSFEDRQVKQLSYTRRSPNKAITQSKVQQVIAIARGNKQRLDTNFSIHQARSAQKQRSKSKIHTMNSNKTLISPLTPLTPRNNGNNDLNSDQQQVQILKDRIRKAERAEKNTAQALKEARDEIQKRKSKISQLQYTKSQYEQGIKMREEKIKKYQRQIKELSEQNEEFINQLRTSKNQNDIRENVSKEQIKKLQQKYRLSQSEREKVTEQYNKTLKNYEQHEKKSQTILREKQKSIHQQKLKTNKKLEQISMNLAQKDLQLKQISQQLQESIRSSSSLSLKITEKDQALQRIQRQLQEQMMKTKSLGETQRQLQVEVQGWKEIEGQKQALKKKYNQTTFMNGQLTDKVAKLQKSNLSLEEKIHQLEEQLTKRTAEKNQISQKLQVTKKNYDTLKASQQQRNKESQSLIILHSNANSKAVDLKSKLQHEKKNLEEQQRDYQNKIASLLTERQNLMTQCQELRWQLEKGHSVIQQLTVQIRSFNQQNYTLSEEGLEKAQKIRRVEEKLKTVTLSYESLQINLTENENKRRQENLILKQATNERNQLKKKGDKLQKQLQQLRQKLKTIQSTLKERTHDYEKRLRQKQQLISAKNNQISLTQSNLKQTLDEVGSLKHQLVQNNQQILHLKEIISNSKKDFDSQQSLILKLKQSQGQTKRVLEAKQEQLSRKSKEADEITKKLNKIIEQANLSQNSIINNFEKYLNEILASQEEIKWSPSPSTISSLSKIAQLQLQTIQKHNVYVSKAKAKLSQLAIDKQNIEYSLSKVTVQLQQLKQLSQSQLIREKQKYKQQQKAIKSLQSQLSQSQAKHEENIHSHVKQFQVVKLQLSKKQQEKLQLQSQITIILAQYDSLKEQNKDLEDRLSLLRSQQLQYKNTEQNKYQNLNENHLNQVKQYSNYIVDIQKRIIALQKENKEKTEIIKRYEQQLHQIRYQKDKRQAKIVELSEKINDSIKDSRNLQMIIKQKQRQLKRSLQNQQQLANAYRVEKDKYQDILYKSQQQNNVIIDISRELEKTKDQYNIILQKSQQVQQTYKSRVDSLRIQGEKFAYQVKELKEKLIASSSQAQLKKFVMKQLQTTLSLQKQQRQQLRSQVDKKKSQIQSISQTNNLLQLKIKELQNNLQESQAEKQRLISNLQRQKSFTASSHKNSQELISLNDQITQLQRQLQRAQQQKQQAENYYERQLIEIKSSLRQTKRIENSKIGRQQQLKKKIKVMEKLLESDDYDLTTSRKRILQQIQKEKRDYLSKNENLQSKLIYIEEQNESLKGKYKRELERLEKIIEGLEQENRTKDFFIKNQQFQIDTSRHQINSLLAQKNQNQKQLQKQRNRSKNLQKQAQTQNQILKDSLKRMQQEQLRSAIEIIKRKLSRSKKRRMESGTKNDIEELIVSGDYRDFEQILIEVVREKGLL